MPESSMALIFSRVPYFMSPVIAWSQSLAVAYMPEEKSIGWFFF